MKKKLHDAWQTRSPRDRMIIIALLLMLGAALYIWLVQSGGQARMRLGTAVTMLRAQAERLDQQAIEYGRLRAAPPATVSPTDLRTLVQSQINETGLARALLRIDVSDADQVMVVFDAVAFVDWLKWVNGLNSQRIRLDSCRIEALSTSGLVSVTATLVRTKVQ